MQIIYREERDRWFRGDRFVRPLVRRALRGQPTQFSGMQRIVRNFLAGLDQKGIDYKFNVPTAFLKRSCKIISFGLGAAGVDGLHRDNPVIAAIGFPYPSVLPDLCSRYNIKKFLQHSNWTLDFVKSANIYDDKIFDLWPAGIDINEWRPSSKYSTKEVDVLIYNKIRWNKSERDFDLVLPIKNFLKTRGISFEEICYGSYTLSDYKKHLARCRVMIFLAENESQGLAYQECMASDVPVFAWEQGFWLDPERFILNKPIVPAASVPYFDERCGLKFKNLDEFVGRFEYFFSAASRARYSPREFVIDNLSIEKSTDRMLAIYNSI